MTIAKGDVLLFEDTGSVATVLHGDSTNGWDALIEAHGTVVHVPDAAALTDQATFIADPSGRPATGSIVVLFNARSTELWRVDGYATTPAFGASSHLAVLTNLNDASRSCYVDASNVLSG